MRAAMPAAADLWPAGHRVTLSCFTSTWSPSTRVAALVHSVRPDGVSVTLVNTDVLEGRPMIIQAGAFGEHCFTTATFGGTGTVVSSHCLCLVCFHYLRA